MIAFNIHRHSVMMPVMMRDPLILFSICISHIIISEVFQSYWTVFHFNTLVIWCWLNGMAKKMWKCKNVNEKNVNALPFAFCVSSWRMKMLHKDILPWATYLKHKKKIHCSHSLLFSLFSPDTEIRTLVGDNFKIFTVNYHQR